MSEMTRTEELLALIENTKRAERIRPARKSTLSTELIENNTIKQLVELVRLQHDRLVGAEVFVNSKECIKQPEGRDWYEEAIAAFNKFEQGGE